MVRLTGGGVRLTSGGVRPQMLCLQRGAGSGASQQDPLAIHVSTVARPGPPPAAPAPSRPQAAKRARLAQQPPREEFRNVEVRPDGSVWLTRDWRAVGRTEAFTVPLLVMHHLGLTYHVVRPFIYSLNPKPFTVPLLVMHMHHLALTYHVVRRKYIYTHTLSL